MDEVGARSDRLDFDIAAYALRDAQRRRWVNLLLAAMVVLNVLTLVITLRVADDTHRAVTAQIPGLETQIATQHEAIADMQSIIDQAVAVILRLAQQVKTLGGDPGDIVLKPPD